MSYPIRVRAGALIIENDAILLIEFDDENGLHYNLPAGGVEPNESVKEAAKREAREEAAIEVNVGPLAFTYEYAPHLTDNRYGTTHSLGLMFECTRIGDSEPKLPDKADLNQTGVKWIPLKDLEQITLYPKVQRHIKAFIDQKRYNAFIEEHTLENYEKV
ncbi:NUDIX domain-containing protein [Fictibacillus sp. 18YEL24]|uniref:NUDIX domain-containing protein n=1 Tax=Fictibacillus sp. 18YEL24 TaxID=2745875 RepID=UPI0018CD384E|nr:NUDIX domain-containing protein [Fictibacillus sp. 18YEL24]MBH0170157.1 NUDIX domain-containing protein [Fictibacillus sp. 18YEL24]